MTAIHWLNAINGSFTNAADWSGGVVPGVSDDAILDAIGPTFTVTSYGNEKVASVQLASNATLSLLAGTFDAENGTGGGVNAGIILVGAGAALEVGGTVTNTGTIELNGSSGGGNSVLEVDSLATTLTGGGEVLLAGSGRNLIAPTFGRSQLYNINNTIVGVGITAKKLDIGNVGGTIDANSNTALIIKGSIFDNGGIVEATGAGGIIVKGGRLGSNDSGIILAAAGSKVELVNAIVNGGVFETAGSGKLIFHSSSINGTYYRVTLNTDANVEGRCSMDGMIQNNDSINLSGSAEIYMAGTLTLQGTGSIDLHDNYIDSAGPNAGLNLESGTIKGSGTINGSSWALPTTIGAEGVIAEDGASALVLETNAAVVNAGTIESTGLGGVVIDDAIVNSGILSVQGGGTLEVEGAVTGKGVAEINGGTLDFLSSFNEAANFTGKTGTLELAQSPDFTNTVKGFSHEGETTLDLRDIGFVGAGEATFSGTGSGGVLTVTDGNHTAKIKLNGDYLAATFVASSDGHGGTDVVATSPQASSAVHFVSAMAAMTGHGAASGLIDVRAVSDGGRMTLAAPRLALA